MSESGAQIVATIPADLPPGHALRVEGAFTGGPSPIDPPEVLTEDGEVLAGAVPAAGPEGLQGYVRQSRLQHKRLQLFEEGGRLRNRRLLGDRCRPLPVRVMETDEIRGYGEYAMNIRTVNERGEESVALASETVFLAPAPLSVSDQQLDSYDDVSDVATFGCVHDTLR